MSCVQIHSLKECGKKSLVVICQILLIAADYICSSVALVSKLIWKVEKSCTNYFTWLWTMPRNCNCCSSNSSWFVFLLDAGCQTANKSERKKSGKGMILAQTKFKQTSEIPSIFPVSIKYAVNAYLIHCSVVLHEHKQVACLQLFCRGLQERITTLFHMALSCIVPFYLQGSTRT